MINGAHKMWQMAWIVWHTCYPDCILSFETTDMMSKLCNPRHLHYCRCCSDGNCSQTVHTADTLSDLGDPKSCSHSKYRTDGYSTYIQSLSELGFLLSTSLDRDEHYTLTTWKLDHSVTWPQVCQRLAPVMCSDVEPDARRLPRRDNLKSA